MFRHIINFIPVEEFSTPSYEIKDSRLVPESCSQKPPFDEYTLPQLLASGLKVQSVPTEIIHDSSAASSVVDSLINNPNNSNSVSNED